MSEADVTGRRTIARRELWLLDDSRTFGGGQVIALRLARFIASESPDRSVVMFCPDTSELARRCRTLGIPVHDASFPDLAGAAGLRILGTVRKLRRQLAGAPENVVVVGCSLRAQVYAHAASIGLPTRVALVQFMIEQDSARRRTGVLLLRRFGAIVALGGNAARAYTSALGDTKVIKANNFLLPEELNGPAAPPPPETGRAPVLGVLARLIREKGVLELVEELTTIRSAWSRLVVAGNADDQAYSRRLEARIASLGLEEAVSLLGHVSDVPAFCAGVDFIVVPSVGNEGQPTVILEALSCGRPVIVREHVWSEEFEGLPVMPYRDASDLARALQFPPQVSDHRAELQRRFGVAQVLEAFDHAAAE